MLASDASSRTSARTQKQDMDSPAQARSMPRLGQVKLLAQQHMSGLWYCGSRSIAETLDFATPISGNALEVPVYIDIQLPDLIHASAQLYTLSSEQDVCRPLGGQ